MARTIISPLNKNFRIQGTDGIRRETALSSAPELAGLSPQQALLERGYITERLMELYAYAQAQILLRAGSAKPVSDFVIGWDPRDATGTFTEAVIRGVRKAGCNALALGVVPTPLAQMFIAKYRCAGGFMVTASHNPAGQNGVKTFLAYRGMKLLPANDIALTRRVLALDYKDIARKPLVGKKIDCHKKARKLFERFSLQAENSWGEDFSDITVVVDPANGSLTDIAAAIFRKAGFGKVVETNNKRDGNVNYKSGVGDLEGRPLIAAAMIAPTSGLFAKHRAIVKLFQLGRKHKAQIKAGRLRVCGAVFDADGDRFYRLDYHPGKDALLVLDGDKTAFLQAEYLLAKNPGLHKGDLFINTVESDLNAGKAIEKIGLKWQLSAVGDKWILLRIALLEAEGQLAGLLKTLKRRKNNPPANKFLKRATVLKARLRECKNADALDANCLRDIDSAIKSLRLSAGIDNAEGGRIPFAIGCEETGHTITAGQLNGDPPAEVYFGNGVKSALNTFSATQFLLKGKSVREYFARLERPFQPGIKETFYAYYIMKGLFCKNSPLWRRIKKVIAAEAKQKGFTCSTLNFRDDPDMLFLALNADGAARGRRDTPENGIFIRNSGTENKISVNLRGGKKNARALKSIGETCIRLLLPALKDQNNRYYKLEQILLSQIAKAPLPESALKGPAQKQVAAAMLKQDLVQPGAKGFRLTARGKWYTASC